MSTDTMLNTTRSVERTTPAILSNRAGVFWGATLLLVGMLWFLDAAEVINLGNKFAELVVPFMLMVAGIYLLAMKVRR